MRSGATATRARPSCAPWIWQRQGSDPYFISYAETGLGLAYLGEEQPAAAVAPLESALRTRMEKHSAPELTGETRFALARALWARPAARQRARELAQQARADYQQVKVAVDIAAKIAAWLRAPSARL
jgi:hypothetical protein